MKAMINRYQEVSQEAQENNDAAIREKMICEHASLVKYLAERFAFKLPNHISTEELISAGTIGLFNALDNFDSRKGIKFKTYAAYRIKGAMLDELRRLDWVPRSIRKDIQCIERAMATFRARENREPDDMEVAEELGVDVQRYYQMLRKTQGVRLVSLDEVKRDGGGSMLANLISERPSPYDDFKKQELRELIADVIAHLPEREQRVLSLYYYEEMTLKEISKVLGLTESRISQIHSKAILSLRSKMKPYHDS